MPTTYTDEFYVMDPYAPPAPGTPLTVYTLDITDRNNNGVINQYNFDNVEGYDIIAAYPGDTVTVQYPSGQTDTITGTTFYLSNGYQVFTPTDGSTLQDAVFVSSTYTTVQGNTTPAQLQPVCFVAGTRILTEAGQVPVEDLKPGDPVTIADYSSVPVRLVLRRQVCRRELAESPKLAPVRLAAGALGRGLPRRDLLVSRQHRMLVSSRVAERMLGSRDVLIPAIKLLDLPGITLETGMTEVTYLHLLLDRHEVIFAEGAPTESLLTGAEAMKSMSREARAEILTLFPDIARSDAALHPARPIPSGRQQRQLVARHARNQRPLLERPRRSVA